MSILSMKPKTDMDIVCYGFQNIEFLAHDVVTLSYFESIIYYSAVKHLLSYSDLNSRMKRHRSKSFR